MNPLLIKNYEAGATVNARRIVTQSAANIVIQASAVSTRSIGVTDTLSANTGERIDVIHAGIAFLEAGAAITLNANITSDASGRGVAAAPSAGVNNMTIGVALEAASAAGDIIRVLVAPGVMQG